MRDAQNGGRHPPVDLLDASAGVGQVVPVVHGREPGAADTVQLLLGLLLHFGEQQYGLDKAGELRSRGIGTRL